MTMYDATLYDSILEHLEKEQLDGFRLMKEESFAFRNLMKILEKVQPGELEKITEKAVERGTILLDAALDNDPLTMVNREDIIDQAIDDYMDSVRTDETPMRLPERSIVEDYVSQSITFYDALFDAGGDSYDEASRMAFKDAEGYLRALEPLERAAHNVMVDLNDKNPIVGLIINADTYRSIRKTMIDEDIKRIFCLNHPE